MKPSKAKKIFWFILVVGLLTSLVADSIVNSALLIAGMITLVSSLPIYLFICKCPYCGGSLRTCKDGICPHCGKEVE